MKYCYHCGRTTVGEPLFCNFCGRSYDVRLCPKLHANPRGTLVCSKCGSRELSTPQPRVTLWTKVLVFSLTAIAGAILSAITLALLALFFGHVLFGREMTVGLVVIGATLGALSWGWSEVPRLSRCIIRRVLRKKNTDKGNRSHARVRD